MNKLPWKPWFALDGVMVEKGFAAPWLEPKEVKLNDGVEGIWKALDVFPAPPAPPPKEKDWDPLGASEPGVAVAGGKLCDCPKVKPFDPVGAGEAGVDVC